MGCGLSGPSQALCICFGDNLDFASTVPLDVDNEFVRFDKMYDEQGRYIYKIYYKK